MMFFGRPDFNLEAAASGQFALVPGEGMVEGLRRDYDAMVGMILGTPPPFDDLRESIAILEARLNRR